MQKQQQQQQKHSPNKLPIFAQGADRDPKTSDEDVWIYSLEYLEHPEILETRSVDICVPLTRREQLPLTWRSHIGCTLSACLNSDA